MRLVLTSFLLYIDHNMIVELRAQIIYWALGLGQEHE